MKRLTALVLMVGLAFGASLPSYADTPNKYKGVNRDSRKAQQREAKQMRKYAARQRKAERKLNRAGGKHNVYKSNQKPKQR